MMKNANSLLMDLEEQMNMIGLPLMALKLDELYRSSDFLTMDRLEMVSSLLKPEYEDKTEYSVASEPLNPLQRAIHSER